MAEVTLQQSSPTLENSTTPLDNEHRDLTVNQSRSHLNVSTRNISDSGSTGPPTEGPTSLKTKHPQVQQEGIGSRFVSNANRTADKWTLGFFSSEINCLLMGLLWVPVSIVGAVGWLYGGFQALSSQDTTGPTLIANSGASPPHRPIASQTGHQQKVGTQRRKVSLQSSGKRIHKLGSSTIDKDRHLPKNVEASLKNVMKDAPQPEIKRVYDLLRSGGASDKQIIELCQENIFDGFYLKELKRKPRQAVSNLIRDLKQVRQMAFVNTQQTGSRQKDLQQAKESIPVLNHVVANYENDELGIKPGNLAMTRVSDNGDCMYNAISRQVNENVGSVRTKMHECAFNLVQNVELYRTVGEHQYVKVEQKPQLLFDNYIDVHHMYRADGMEISQPWQEFERDVTTGNILQSAVDVESGVDARQRWGKVQHLALVAAVYKRPVVCFCYDRNGSSFTRTFGCDHPNYDQKKAIFLAYDGVHHFNSVEKVAR